mgnify:CR=1 FL=1
MTLDKLWGLPSKTVVLSTDELLLLDWVMCSASRLIPEATVGELVVAWGGLRVEVWHCLSKVDLEQHDGEARAKAQHSIDLSESDAKTLLALIPTTFRWGTGVDCGYSLKMKLYRFLTNDYPVKKGEDDVSTSSTSENKAPDQTPGSTTDSAVV